MSDSTDMSTPVTRGEFAEFEVRLEQRLAQLATKAELEQRLVPLATKVELELWGGALLARVLARHERGTEMLWRHERAKPK